ncbi:MAG TPA: YebC/PmpR family DNA-binding transcriptional regulator [Candidatus Paceibacterota bacterium]|nr:YebC/PmpR family DNA-binding transcriptional regulator [Candidatus Paceibacterota bacterium]
MSGHSKWKQIKYKKATSDAKKSKLFSKLALLIANEAKKSGGDKNAPGLRAAIEKARAENMPGESIDRAIARANRQQLLESITYEGYGPGGVGIIVEALTANRNKVVAEIKHAFSKYGGTLGAIGSVAWGFSKEHGEWTPTTTMPLDDDEAEKLGALVDALEESDEVHAVYTNAA